MMAVEMESANVWLVVANIGDIYIIYTVIYVDEDECLESVGANRMRRGTSEFR
jgi:hypothetical protein